MRHTGRGEENKVIHIWRRLESEQANELRRRTWWSLVETLDGANKNRTDETLIPLTSDDARAPTETLSSASRSGSPSNGHKRWNNTGPPEADINARLKKGRGATVMDALAPSDSM